MQPDGKILLGGNFDSFNGSPRSGIARLNADGTLDASFVPGTNLLGPSIVEYIALQSDGKILAAGTIGSPLRGLIRLNTDGSSDAGFAPVLTDLSGYSVTVQPDSRVVFTGYFMQINGAQRLGIARLNADGTVDSTFNAAVSRFAQVNDIAIQPDGKTIVVGSFLYARGVPRRNIARFNTNGTLDTTFDPGTGTAYAFGVDTIVKVALQSDGKTIAVGRFTSYNGSTAVSIVRVNPDGSFDPSFDSSTMNPPPPAVPFLSDVMILPNCSLVISGSGVIGGRRVAHLSSTGTYDSAFANFNINGVVQRVVREPGGSFLIGGLFTTVADRRVRGPARLPGRNASVAALGSRVAGRGWSMAREPSASAEQSAVCRFFANRQTFLQPRTGANGTFSIALRAGEMAFGGAFSTLAPRVKSMVLLMWQH